MLVVTKIMAREGTHHRYHLIQKFVTATHLENVGSVRHCFLVLQVAYSLLLVYEAAVDPPPRCFVASHCPVTTEAGNHDTVMEWDGSPR